MKSTLMTVRATPVTMAPALTRSMATNVLVNPATQVKKYNHVFMLFMVLPSVKECLRQKLPLNKEEQTSTRKMNRRLGNLRQTFLQAGNKENHIFVYRFTSKILLCHLKSNQISLSCNVQ